MLECYETGCRHEVTHTDSVIDADNSLSLNNVRYKTIYLCPFHAAQRARYVGNTARVTPITESLKETTI